MNDRWGPSKQGGLKDEWPTLRPQARRDPDGPAQQEPCPSCQQLVAAGVPVTCEAGLHPPLVRPTA